MSLLNDIKGKAINFFKPNHFDDILTKAMPLINYQTFYTFNTTTPAINYAMLWLFVKQTPEVVAILTAIAEDIVSDGYDLKPIEGSGRNKILKAEKYLRDNHFQEELLSFLYDLLVTGDAYFFKNKLSEIQVKNVIENVYKHMDVEFKSLDYDSRNEKIDNMLWDIKSEETDVFADRAFQSVPSATMFANYDEYGNVNKWTQKIGPKSEEFRPEQIIHYRYMRVNGEFYGFSPLRSLIVEQNIIKRLKDYELSYFERGGQQNIYVLEEENPTTDNYNLFKSELLRAAQAPERWKNMVVTGKVNQIRTNEQDKDMEFKELAKYVTNVMMMAWNIPMARISDIGEKSGQGSSTLSIEGYYRKIRHEQQKIECLINEYLLKDYGVEIHFHKSYKEDEVRDSQIEKVRSDIVEQRYKMGIVNKEWVWDFLNIPENFRGEMIDPKEMMNTGLHNQDLLNKHQQLSESPKKAADQDKQEANVKSLMEKGYTQTLAEAIAANL